MAKRYWSLLGARPCSHLGPGFQFVISRYLESMKPAEEPLYEIKANLFRALAHPVRIRVLELLATAASADPAAELNVTTLLSEINVSPSQLSGHLSVLRNYHVVVARRSGSHVFYRIAHPGVVDLLDVARGFLRDVLAEKGDQLLTAANLPPLR